MPARPATLRDPSTPSQIVMEQHNLTHFQSQLWCKMCVESRGHDSPQREQSKIDATVPQLEFDYGYVGDGGPLQIACFLVGGRHLFWSPYTRRWCQTPRRWTCPVWWRQQQSWYVTWSVHSTQKINDLSYNQLISNPSTYVKKRTQRSEDSILLRHMDDVVGTGPDEQLKNERF